MLAIAIRFLAGRYHATPWGRHVNEADVEWPPSPWRLLRALIATWHRKLDPESYPEAVLERLVNALSRVLPVYRLPEAVHAHTRHYMPVREGRADKPVLVFDAFLRLNPDEPLIIAWPEIELSADETALLDRLLADIGFLGRAESWVECRRLDDWDAQDANCRADDLAIDPATGENLEPVRLLAPVAAGEYDAWRNDTLVRIDLKSFPKKKREMIESTLSGRLIDALRLDTAEVQAAGWSRAPGAQEILFHRPDGALAVRRRQAVKRGDGARITMARFALAGRPLPRLENAVRIGELIRSALMHHAKWLFGEGHIPPVLSGHGLPEHNRHGHAFFLPEDADMDGRIDHVTVYVPDGCSVEVLRIFDRLNRLYEREGHEWSVVLEGIGGDDAFAIGMPDTSRILGIAAHWESVTPYLHPWHRKKQGFGHAEQLRRECRQRGLPEPDVELVDSITIKGRKRRPVHFHRFRDKRGLIQPDTHGCFARLSFAEPVRGPVALGFGCHFGLGMFRPV